MKRNQNNILKGKRGSSFLSVLIAAAIIVVAIGGVGASALRLGRALTKAEIANMAVSVEANLVASFHDKRNYPDPGGSVASPNLELRNGTIQTFPLQVTFSGGAPIALSVPVDPAQGVVRFLDANLVECVPQAFSPTCLLRFEVRMRKTGASSYAFAYKVDANPNVLVMAPLGNETAFSIPIDPGNYRAEINRTTCNSDASLFITGVNRDTGEVLCAQKPKKNGCEPRKMAKGLAVHNHDDGPPTVDLICTQAEMRTFRCPPNYALQKFNPQYVDPENTSFSSVPGKCVLFTATKGVMQGSFPANPRSPYLKSISGTFCPPNYMAEPSGCRLVPDDEKNANPSIGLGQCAPTLHKNCQRTSTTRVSDNGAAYKTWSECITAKTPTGKQSECGAAPANPVWTITCSSTQISYKCDGTANSGTECENTTGWDSGTAYADASRMYTMEPKAVTKTTISGRKLSCGYQDISQTCNAPSTDYSGKTWPKKNPKWYGGVQVSGLPCTQDPTQGKPEVVDAY